MAKPIGSRMDISAAITRMQRGLVCPSCRAPGEFSVYYTRPGDNCIIRSRICRLCGHETRTAEKIIDEIPQEFH